MPRQPAGSVCFGFARVSHVCRSWLCASVARVHVMALRECHSCAGHGRCARLVVSKQCVCVCAFSVDAGDGGRHQAGEDG